MSQEETIEILQELLNSIKSRGVKKTLNLLRSQAIQQIEVTDPFDKFIITEVLQSFNITLKDLLYGKYQRGDAKYAIGLCVYYMYERKSIGEIHKAVFANKNKTLLSKYRQVILDLNKQIPEEANVLQIMKTIDKNIENYKKENQ